MNLGQIEKNLLVFLDPAGRNRKKHWKFSRTGWHESEVKEEFLCDGKRRKDNIIYRFSRSEIIKYYIFLLTGKPKAGGGRKRQILFVNDGLLSSYFDVRNKSYYRLFAQRHLPKPNGFRRKLASVLPVVVRAEQRFIVVEEPPSYGDINGEEPARNNMEEQDFMFFSNAAGKLLLTRGETFLNGHGKLLKTTANPDYVKVLEREYATISKICGLVGKPWMVPRGQTSFSINGRYYIFEDYIQGRNLREIIYELARENDFNQIIKIFDLLEEWFKDYRTSFSGGKKTITSMYMATLKLFSELYENDEHTNDIIEIAGNILDSIDGKFPGYVPIISHCDLWPGNFMIQSDRLTAIDWERAVEDRPPLFDYYWMIISTTIEVLIGCGRLRNYSNGFRTFMEQQDIVSRYARKKIIRFLGEIGIGKNFYFPLFLLFLIEWSVQGYVVFGRQTDMDKIAFAELIHFKNSNRLETKNAIDVKEFV